MQDEIRYKSVYQVIYHSRSFFYAEVFSELEKKSFPLEVVLDCVRNFIPF